MTIYFAGGGEAWYDNTTNKTVDLLAGQVGAGGVANRASGWGQQDGSYSISSLIDANNENGSVQGVSGIGVNPTSGSYTWKMQLPASLITPAANFKVFEFGGAGIWPGYHFAISAAGNVEWRNSASVPQATWSSPGFTADVPYWWKVMLDASGNIKLYVGLEGRAGQLNNARDWAVAVIDYTDGAQAGGILGVPACGPKNYKLNNANGGPGLFDSYVFGSTEPRQPRIPRLAQLTGDGHYSGGSTTWTKSGGGAATYTVIDDPTSAAVDESDYIDYPVPDGSGDDRFSATISTSSTLGITDRSDSILAVLPLIWIRRKAGTVALPANNKLFLRYSGTDLDGSRAPTATSTTYSNAIGTNSNFWEVFNTPPGGGAWATAVIDGLEIGMDHNDTDVSFDCQYEIAWMGAYVITERLTSLAARSTAPRVGR